MSGIVPRLNRFWHHPIDDRVYGLLRAGYALVALINVIAWMPAGAELLSDSGIYASEVATRPVSGPGFSLFLLIENDAAVAILLTALIAVHLMLLLGIAPRFCLILSFLWGVSYLTRAPHATGGWDLVLGNVCFILLWSPTGRSWHLGTWLSGWTGKEVTVPWTGTISGKQSPRYGVVLIRMLVFVIYWMTLINRKGDEFWANGDAFGYFLVSDYCWFGGPWVLQSTLLIRLASWISLGIEFLLPLLLTFRSTWKIGFATGVVFHLFLAISAPKLLLFSLSMVMTYAAFYRFREAAKR